MKIQIYTFLCVSLLLGLSTLAIADYYQATALVSNSPELQYNGCNYTFTRDNKSVSYGEVAHALSAKGISVSKGKCSTQNWTQQTEQEYEMAKAEVKKEYGKAKSDVRSEIDRLKKRLNDLEKRMKRKWKEVEREV